MRTLGKQRAVKPLRDQFLATPHDPDWVPRRNDAVIVRTTKQTDRKVPGYTYMQCRVESWSGPFLKLVRVQVRKRFRLVRHEDVRPFQEDVTA